MSNSVTYIDDSSESYSQRAVTGCPQEPQRPKWVTEIPGIKIKGEGDKIYLLAEG